MELLKYALAGFFIGAITLLFLFLLYLVAHKYGDVIFLSWFILVSLTALGMVFYKMQQDEDDY